MKKATITFITSAALAFAMPLYAANESGMKTDSQPQTGITKQDTKYDSEQRPDVTQGMKSDSQSQAGLAQQQSGKMITAEELEGMEVVTQNGEELGEIEKITINKETGEVQYVTFSRGGILGMGDEEIAVPLSAFEIRDDKARLTVDQSKLDNVPQQKTEVSNNDYLRDLETHYGVAPAWEKGNQGDTPKTQETDQNSTEPRKLDTKK